MRILRMSGDGRSYDGTGTGKRWHFVEVPADAASLRIPALCGARPALRWSAEQGERATCWRCIERFGIAQAYGGDRELYLKRSLAARQGWTTRRKMQDAC